MIRLARFGGGPCCRSAIKTIDDVLAGGGWRGGVWVVLDGHGDNTINGKEKFRLRQLSVAFFRCQAIAHRAHKFRQGIDVAVSQAYSRRVPEKNGTEFCSSCDLDGRPPPRRFLRPSHAMPLWAAMAGRLRPAGILDPRSANLVICRPPRFAARNALQHFSRRLICQVLTRPTLPPKHSSNHFPGTQETRNHAPII